MLSAICIAVLPRTKRTHIQMASIKSIEQLLAVARNGAWGATIPIDLAERMIEHEGTEAALARFAEVANDQAPRPDEE